MSTLTEVANNTTKAAAPKNTKASKGKAAPKVKKPQGVFSGITTSKTGSYTSRTGNEFAARHKGSVPFSASGAKYAVSPIMRYLGFWFGASKAECVAWLRAEGFEYVTAACAGHQSGSGRNTKADKNGNPVPGDHPECGPHGSIPALTDADYRELLASFVKANPETRNAKGESK